MGLRALAEADLAVTLEDADNGFGLPIELISPDGERQTVNGQVLYDSVVSDEAGAQTVIHKPVVTVRRSSLTRVPLPTDSPRWACRIPSSPLDGADLASYIVEQAPESGGTIGFLRLYLTRAESST